MNYIRWITATEAVGSDRSVGNLIWKQLRSETEKMRAIVYRILSVILVVTERDLAFRGASQNLGDPSNGNFLCAVLNEHLMKVRAAQESGKKLQAHYLWN